MNIIFLSNYYPEQTLSYFQEFTNVGLDYAAHNLNMSLRNGFLQHNVDYFEINHPNIGAWPKLFRKLRIPSFNYSNGYSISFLNFPYLKRFSIAYGLEKQILIRASKNDDTVLLLYNFDTLSILKILKKRIKRLKIVLMVTDLPEYMDVNNDLSTRINRFLRKYNKSFCKNQQYYVDGYVLLAPRMTERLPVGTKPWLHLEGIYNMEYSPSQTVSIERNKIILYTGNLGYRYGIMNLVHAFMRLESKDYKLYLRGSGEAEDEIKEACKLDNRIKIIPPLERKELLKLQRCSSFLINPVGKDEEFTHYFFPSKTLEYLASETPTIMCNLDCIPIEYSQHIINLPNNSVDSICQTLRRCINMSQNDLTEFGQKSSSFIRDNKCPEKQVGKLLNFLKQI